MYDLKAYLESTDSVIPQQLAKHASAQQPPGTPIHTDTPPHPTH